MFKLSGASVFYGSTARRLNGLERDFDMIESLDALDLDALARRVGQLTGFPRTFTAQHCPSIDLVALVEAKGEVVPPTMPREIPERIVAMADGYTVTWNRVVEKQ